MATVIEELHKCLIEATYFFGNISNALLSRQHFLHREKKVNCIFLLLSFLFSFISLNMIRYSHVQSCGCSMYLGLFTFAHTHTQTQAHTESSTCDTRTHIHSHTHAHVKAFHNGNAAQF